MKNPFVIFNFEDACRIDRHEYERAVKQVPKRAAERAAWLTLWAFCAFLIVVLLAALYFGARPLFWIIVGFGGTFLTLWGVVILWNKRKLDLTYATSIMVRE